MDERLLKAGRDLLPRMGVSGLNVRRVAKKARVNPGMFHYHFKTKDAFARRVLQAYYEEIFSTLETEAAGGASPLESLRAVLLAFGRIARDKRQLLLSLLRDAVLGEAATLDFMRANLHRHVELLLRLIGQAQASGTLGPMAPFNALLLLLAGVNLPALFAEAAITRARLPRIVSLAGAIERQVLSDEAIAERVDALLRGLRTNETARESAPPTPLRPRKPTIEERQI
jgi:AcrR family transcriptional regulator